MFAKKLKVKKCIFVSSIFSKSNYFSFFSFGNGNCDLVWIWPGCVFCHSNFKVLIKNTYIEDFIFI